MFQKKEQPRRESASFLEEVYEYLETAVFTAVAVLLVFTFIAYQATVNGRSMVPTLHDKERLLLQQLGYSDPQYGDIVVINTPQLDEKVIVKRVIGKAGDTIFVDFEKHEVWRNADKLDEPYINEPTELSYDVKFPVKVPEGHIFVLGDNRNNSLDSRSSEIGMVDVRSVMGKAVFRFFPLQNAGLIE